MNIEQFEARAQPMLYVSRSVSADPAAIAGVMGDAFATLGRFIGEHNVRVTGPPLAVYHSHQDGKMEVEVGFPVATETLSLAAGDVKGGSTPAGKVMRATHRGPYDQLRETYKELEADFRRRGLPLPRESWEVYLNEPERTPAQDLLTQIYMPVA